jgi:SAM-dependent methyltransferase
MLKTYFPEHSSNRMGHEGDVLNARKVYLSQSNKNLQNLLKNRFTWMNAFLSPSDKGVEFGAGIGASRDFILAHDFTLTDFLDSEWLDYKNVDALDSGFSSKSFDFIIASNMIHHLAFPKIFLEECQRILRPGGKLIIQEIHTSLLMRLILRLMRHEGFDETVNVFHGTKPCNQLGDPWSANCSIPKILFNSHEEFQKHYPTWRVIHDRKVEFLQFLNSGGVVAKTRFIPLNPFLLGIQELLDALLTRLAPNVFALQREIVLEKFNPGS